MRFNGADIKSVHHAISINKEIPPGMPERDLRTIKRRRGELLTGYDLQQAEYTVRVNIAGKNKRIAWEARAALAAWATSSGEKAAMLEPTHWPGVAYDAIAKEVQPPEFKFGFGVIEITFVIPEPVAHDMIPSIAKGTNGATLDVGGSWACEPVITYTAAEASDGLVIQADGAKLISIKDAIAAGDVVVIDTQEGGLTINGEHAEKRIIYTDTDWELPFAPGIHKLTASASGAVEARWYNRWA